MPIELILALSGSSIDAVAEALSSQCGQSYARHDSLYLGEYNQFNLPEPLQVKYNFVESEQEWDHPEFKQQNILLVIGATERPEYFRELATKSGFEFKEVQCKSY
jgi:hypothetical protein